MLDLILQTVVEWPARVFFRRKKKESQNKDENLETSDRRIDIDRTKREHKFSASILGIRYALIVAAVTRAR